MQLTRRELAGALASAAAALEQPPAQSAEQLRLAAAERVRARARRLTQYDIPMTTEPAATFHA